MFADSPQRGSSDGLFPGSICYNGLGNENLAELDKPLSMKSPVILASGCHHQQVPDSSGSASSVSEMLKQRLNYH
jgi:hypothetical protein